MAAFFSSASIRGKGFAFSDQCYQCLSVVRFLVFRSSFAFLRVLCGKSVFAFPDHPITRSPNHISPRLRGEIYFADRRNPHSTSTADPTIASPTDRKSAVINVSCQGKAWCPAPVIGESAPIPQAAPSAVVAQFT